MPVERGLITINKDIQSTVMQCDIEICLAKEGVGSITLESASPPV